MRGGGGNNNTICLLKRFIITQSIWPVAYYSQLGTYSQTNTHTKSLLMHMYFNTLYPQNPNSLYSQHVCFPPKLKLNSLSTCPRMPPPPSRGKSHGMVTSEHALTTPTQTHITGGKLVWRYAIPSTTMLLPETERRTKLTGHPQGPEQPNPKPQKSSMVYYLCCGSRFCIVSGKKFKIQNNCIVPYAYMYIGFFYNKVNNSKNTDNIHIYTYTCTYLRWNVTGKFYNNLSIHSSTSSLQS